MGSTTVRITDSSHSALRQLAEDEGESMQAILDKAIRTYQERKFWDETNTAFAALRKDPEAWRQELAEREAWDKTLADGLEGQ